MTERNRRFALASVTWDSVQDRPWITVAQEGATGGMQAIQLEPEQAMLLRRTLDEVLTTIAEKRTFG